MVPIGIATAIVKGREEFAALTGDWRRSESAHPEFPNVIVFGVFLTPRHLPCIARIPNYHRRLMFIATCGLLDSAFTRFEFLLDHTLFFPLVDLVILLGVLRDLVVEAAGAQGISHRSSCALMVVSGLRDICMAIQFRLVAPSCASNDWIVSDKGHRRCHAGSEISNSRSRIARIDFIADLLNNFCCRQVRAPAPVLSAHRELDSKRSAEIFPLTTIL